MKKIETFSPTSTTLSLYIHIISYGECVWVRERQRTFFIPSTGNFIVFAQSHNRGPASSSQPSSRPRRQKGWKINVGKNFYEFKWSLYFPAGPFALFRQKGNLSYLQKRKKTYHHGEIWKELVEKCEIEVSISRKRVHRGVKIEVREIGGRHFFLSLWKSMKYYIYSFLQVTHFQYNKKREQRVFFPAPSWSCAAPSSSGPPKRTCPEFSSFADSFSLLLPSPPPPFILSSIRPMGEKSFSFRW